MSTISVKNAAVSLKDRLILALWVLIGVVLFAMGLFGPAMTIEPSLGKYSRLVELIDPTMTRPSTYSIFGGIVALAEGGNWVLATLVFLFTAIMPLAKLTTYWGIVVGIVQKTALKLAGIIGKFSMVDVLVIAVLVIAVKGLPGDTAVHLRWGFWCFCTSVLITIPLSLFVKRLD